MLSEPQTLYLLFSPLTRRFNLMVARWLLCFQTLHLYPKWIKSLLLPGPGLFFCFPTDSASKSLVRIMSVTWPPLASRYLEKWRGRWIRLVLNEPSYSIYHPVWISKGTDGRKQLHCSKTINYYGDSVVAKISCVLVWVSFEVDSEIRI